MGLIQMSLPQKDLSDCQADADAISARDIQGARETLHGGVPVAERQQSISRGSKSGDAIPAQSFCRFDVTKSLFAVSLLCVNLCHQCVDRWI